MIASLLLAGIGPLASSTPLAFDDPRGRYEIRGRSRSGKSSTIDAVCLALWGTDRHGQPFPVEEISTGCDTARVELVTGSGTIIRRGIDRKRKTTRYVEKRDGTVVEPRTEEAFRESIGAALSRHVSADKGQVAVARLAMVPMSWVPLVQGNARAFRDVLTAMLPAADLRAEVSRLMEEAGHALKPADTLDPKQAEALRRDANRAADVAAGKAKADFDRVKELDGPAPGGPLPADVAEARGLIAAFGAWDLYDSQTRADTVLRAVNADAEAAAAEWDARRAALGERPAYDGALIKAAFNRRREAASAKARAELGAKAAEAKVVRATTALEVAQAAVNAAEGSGDVCPTCGRDGWAHAAEKRAAAAAAVAAAYTAKDAADKDHTAATAELESATRELAAAEEAERVEQAAYAGVEAWDQRLTALGKRPVAKAVAEAPKEPTQPRPSDEDVAAAKALIDAATRAEGAAAQHAAALAAARKVSATSNQANAVAAAEAARLDALVDATRKAPTEIARRQAEALGDLGPVSLRFPDEGAAVEVLINGLPWWLASTGEKVHADLCLRLAFRRLLGMPWLPLFLDEMQSWSEAWPECDGPIIGLRTTRASGIRVVEFGAALSGEDVGAAGERAA